jgi:hypothetical protein
VLAAVLSVVGVLGGTMVALDRWPSAAGRTDQSDQLTQTAPSVAPVLEKPSPSAKALPAVPASSASSPKVGVFRGSSTSNVRAFEKWLGRDVAYVMDFPARDSWAHIANPGYMIREWKGSGYRPVYSVPLLPETGDYTVAEGARGAYDAHYRTLAKNLVAGGQGSAIIRLGWEFNLGSSRWSTDRPQDFIAYWKRAVKAMRSVKGEKLRFEWNVNVGDTTYAGYRYYPGGAYVDYVGVDVYDVSWVAGTYPYPAGCSAACRLARQKSVWSRLHGGRYGLDFWANFAEAKGKPLALSEWGLWKRPDGHGGGDNPYFIRRMHEFITDPDNRVAYQGYFENNSPDGQHRLMTSLPKAGSTFRSLFGD